MSATEPAMNPVECKEVNGQKPAENLKNGRGRLLWIVTGVFLIIALAWIIYYLAYLQFHESTDDAYVNGNLININSAIYGSVVAFYADDTDLVKEGQLLVKFDTTSYGIAYEKELAALASTTLQVRQLYDSVPLNQANVESKRAAYEKAQFDFDNRSQLISSQAVSNEDYIHAKDDLAIARSNLEQAEYQWQVSKDAAGNTPPAIHPLIEQQKAVVRTAYYNLRHCNIYAPATGYVAQRMVDIGEWVEPTRALMAVIPTDYMWVDANFKETELTYMRVGQPATVWLDIYGSKVKYEGKVLGIASGSGSVFSLIPPQNATGNWIKIVQRLAVRISLDPETLKNYPARLGLSAEVNVDITDQNLPMLVQDVSKKTVGTTSVFDLDLEQVNQLIDQIIKTNLEKSPDES